MLFNRQSSIVNSLPRPPRVLESRLAKLARIPFGLRNAEGHVSNALQLPTLHNRGRARVRHTDLCFHKLLSDWSRASKRSEERRVGKSVDLGGRRIIKKKKQ